MKVKEKKKRKRKEMRKIKKKGKQKKVTGGYACWVDRKKGRYVRNRREGEGDERKGKWKREKVRFKKGI